MAIFHSYFDIARGYNILEMSIWGRTGWSWVTAICCPNMTITYNITQKRKSEWDLRDVTAGDPQL